MSTEYARSIEDSKKVEQEYLRKFSKVFKKTCPICESQLKLSKNVWEPLVLRCNSCKYELCLYDDKVDFRSMDYVKEYENLTEVWEKLTNIQREDSYGMRTFSW